MTTGIVPNTQLLPVIVAYQFGAAHGLETEIAPIKVRKHPKKHLTACLHRALITKLFKKHGVFQKFIEEWWLNGKEDDGQKLIAKDLELIVNDPNLEEEYDAEHH